MGKEIERKFLVNGDSYLKQATDVICIRQGYLFNTERGVVRIRISGPKGFITVKTPDKGGVRGEWEYEIPVSDALELLDHCQGHVIVKQRYIVPMTDGLKWEVDVFEEDLAPLKLAEIELPCPDAPFQKPDFVGREVTHDPRYFNSALAAQV